MRTTNRAIGILPQYDYPNPPTKKGQIEGYMNLIRETHRLGNNIGEFFVCYQEAFRSAPSYLGRKIGLNPNDFEDYLFNGSQKFGFRPDIIRRYSQGYELVEVKSSCDKASQFFLGFSQIKGYLLELLKRIEAGDRLPLVSYSLFNYVRGPRFKGTSEKTPKQKYGVLVCEKFRNPDPRTNLGLHICGKDCLDYNLSQNIIQGIIFPYNLLLVLLTTKKFHRKVTKNHANSRYNETSHDYVTLSTTFMSQLNGMSNKFRKPRSIEELLKDSSIDEGLAEKLKVYELEIINECSPENIYSIISGKQHHLRSFPLTRLVNTPKDHRRWLEYLYENAREIFEDRLKLGMLESSPEDFNPEEFENLEF